MGRSRLVSQILLFSRVGGVKATARHQASCGGHALNVLFVDEVGAWRFLLLDGGVVTTLWSSLDGNSQKRLRDVLCCFGLITIADVGGGQLQWTVPSRIPDSRMALDEAMRM